MPTILIFTKFLSDLFDRPLDFMALNWMMHNFTGCENVLGCTWHYRCRIFCFNQFYATLWLYLTSETIVLWTIILSQWKSLRQNALSRHFAKHIWWWLKWKTLSSFRYSVTHISIHPSKELCSKMAPGEVGVSLPWWYHALVLLAPAYWRLFLNLIIFS